MYHPSSSGSSSGSGGGNGFRRRRNSFHNLDDDDDVDHVMIMEHLRLERSRINFLPPFFCCPDIRICQPVHLKVFAAKLTWGKFLKDENPKGLSYHLHRHNMEDIVLSDQNKDIKTAFKFFLLIPHQNYDEYGEPDIEWETVWEDFYAPCDTIFMSSERGIGRMRDNKVHSCKGWGLAKVESTFIDKQGYRFTGENMDIFCASHNHYFRVARMQSGGPESDFDEPEEERSSSGSSGAGSPAREKITIPSTFPPRPARLEDSFVLSRAPRRRRRMPRRRLEATIEEQDWVMVEEALNSSSSSSGSGTGTSSDNNPFPDDLDDIRSCPHDHPHDHPHDRNHDHDDSNPFPDDLDDIHPLTDNFNDIHISPDKNSNIVV